MSSIAQICVYGSNMLLLYIMSAPFSPSAGGVAYNRTTRRQLLWHPISVGPEVTEVKTTGSREGAKLPVQPIICPNTRYVHRLGQGARECRDIPSVLLLRAAVAMTLTTTQVTLCNSTCSSCHCTCTYTYTPPLLVETTCTVHGG